MNNDELSILIPSELKVHYQESSISKYNLAKLRKEPDANIMKKWKNFPIGNASDIVVLIYEYMMYLDNIPWEERPMPSILDFALFIGSDEFSIKEVAQSNPDYMKLLCMISDSSKNMLQQKGLTGKFVASQAMFLLKSEHGMEDKKTIEVKSEVTLTSKINERLLESLDFEAAESEDIITVKELDTKQTSVDSQNE